VPNDPLDPVDAKILERLAANARVSNARLAAEVGIAPSTCLTRVRALVERGVIRGFHAEVDQAAVGRPLQAFIAVRLAAHSRAQIDALPVHVYALTNLVYEHVRGPGVLGV
jgi:DNA-binding Lrp family transcriptional regulator